MKKVMLGVLVLVLTTIGLWACGEDGDVTLIERTALVKVGGCHMEQRTPNLRIGLFGTDTSDRLVELASVLVDTRNLDHQPVLLAVEPPEELVWVVEGDGVTRRTRLQLLAYVDADESSTYSEENDGGTVGNAGKDIFFFDRNYSEKNASYGYNLSSGGGSYTQDFAGNPMFIAAGGCN